MQFILQAFRSSVVILRVPQFLLSLVLVCSFGASWLSAESRVTFKTDDGWDLDGTLFMPETKTASPAPVILLLTEPEWIDRTTFSGYLAGKLAKQGVASLAIDFRGMGSSIGKKEAVAFSEKEMGDLRKDVKAALRYLATVKGIDASRVAILGTGLSANFAALEADEDPAVKALVLLSAVMDKDSLRAIAYRSDVPVLSIVGREDKKRFQQASDAFSHSPHVDSDFIVAKGHGTSMFSHTEGLEDQVVNWLTHNLQGIGAEREVTFQSEDGWQLRGRVRIPGGATTAVKVPGVVMVHGAKHDQQTYHQLARELAKKGIATIRFDWRGKGRSIAEGKSLYGINMPEEESGNTYRDAKAAIKVLAEQAEVDPNRIGMIAATAGTGYALRSAYKDNRIQTVVLLTSNNAPTGEAKQFIVESGKPIFAIASIEDVNYNRGSLAEETRLAHSYSPNKESELLLYDDAGRGSEMLKSKPELERMVLRWFVEKLGAESKKKAPATQISMEKR
jgi:dienelactone hydrolase